MSPTSYQTAPPRDRDVDYGTDLNVWLQAIQTIALGPKKENPQGLRVAGLSRGRQLDASAHTGDAYSAIVSASSLLLRSTSSMKAIGALSPTR
jgi:hypothetical protein